MTATHRWRRRWDDEDVQRLPEPFRMKDRDYVFLVAVACLIAGGVLVIAAVAIARLFA